MIDAAERLLDRFAAGRMSRREAAQALVGLALASTATSRSASAATDDPTFRATGLNHLGLRVSDVDRSRQFYQRHFGLSVLEDNSPGNCFLAVGDNYMGLFRSGSPGVDHYCFTVADYSADTAVAKIEGVGLAPRRQQNRVYFDDPDGIEVQVDSRFGSRPGPRT